MTIVKLSLCRKAVELISALSQVCHNHLLRTSIYFSEASSNQVRVTIVWTLVQRRLRASRLQVVNMFLKLI